MDDGVDTGAVGEPGVDHGCCLIDSSADLTDDLVDDPAEVDPIDETDGGADDPARPLDEDLVRAVDHDFGDCRVVEKGVDGPVTEHIAGDLHEKVIPLHLGEAGAGFLVERSLQCLEDPASQLVVGERPVVEDRSELLDDPEVQGDPQLVVQRGRGLSTTFR
jgi:hypothetical protein